MKQDAEKIEVSFNAHFLDNIIVNAITNTDFLQKVRTIIHPDIFRTKEKQTLINIIYEYFDEFKQAPSDHFYDIFEEKKEKMSESLKHRCYELIKNLQNIKSSNVEFILKRIKKAVRHFKLEMAIVQAAQLVKKNKYDDAESIILKAFKDPEVIQETYYNFLKDRSYIEQRLAGKTYTMRSLVEPLDKLIGGFNYTWLVTILGATKSGKSRWLMELCVAAAVQSLKVLFVTLEMRKQEVDDALDQCIGFLGTEPEKEVETMEFVNKDWVKIKKVIPTIYDLETVSKNRKAIAKQGGLIYVADKTSSKFNYKDLETLMDEIEKTEGIIFDVVIVDYLGEMGPVEKGQNKKEKIAANASGLKGIAKDRNVIMFTAQQGNRQAMRSKVFHPDLISDAIEPIFVSDLVMPICQTEKEERFNIYRMYIALYRHGEKGKFVPLVKDITRGGIAIGEGRLLLDDDEDDSKIFGPNKINGKGHDY